MRSLIVEGVSTFALQIESAPAHQYLFPYAATTSIDMQIAGTKCATCHEDIHFVAEGMACAHCKQTYHRSCLAENECPKCGADLIREQSLIKEREEEDRAQLKRDHNASKTILLCLGMIVLIGIRIVHRISRGEPPAYWISQGFIVALMIAIIIQQSLRKT